MWTHICWLYKQCHRLTYFQGRKSAADRENGRVDTRGEAAGVQPWHIHITRHAGSRWGAPVCYGELTLVLCDDPRGGSWGRLKQEGMCVQLQLIRTAVQETLTQQREQLESNWKLKGGRIFANEATDRESTSKIYRGAQYPKIKQLDLKMGGRPK